MTDELFKNLMTLGTSLLVGVGTSVVTVALSTRKFRTERWWERKEEAYAAIISALYLMQRVAGDYLVEMQDEIARERDQPTQAAWVQARQRVDEAAVVGEFVISAGAAISLERLRKELKKAEYIRDVVGNVDEGVELEYDAVGTCLAEIKAAARKDLAV